MRRKGAIDNYGSRAADPAHLPSTKNVTEEEQFNMSMPNTPTSETALSPSITSSPTTSEEKFAIIYAKKQPTQKPAPRRWVAPSIPKADEAPVTDEHSVSFAEEDSNSLTEEGTRDHPRTLQTANNRASAIPKLNFKKLIGPDGRTIEEVEESARATIVHRDPLLRQKATSPEAVRNSSCCVIL